MALIHYQDQFVPQGQPPTPPPIHFIPEIDFWALQILKKSPVYQDFKKYPIAINEEEWRRDGSVLDLLFNYTFDSASYSIHYLQVDKVAITDTNIVNRSAILANQLRYWVCDTTSAQIILPGDSTALGEGVQIIDDVQRPTTPCTSLALSLLTAANVFSITTGEKDLLDILFLHKTGVDVSSYLIQIDYNSLPSPLSKLIYIYLDIEVNDNYFLYDNDTPVNTEDRLIVTLFEKFVLDHLYRKISFRPSISEGSYMGDSEYTHLVDRLEEDDIINKRYLLPSTLKPISGEYIFFVHNGIYQVLNTDYNYQESGLDTTSPSYIINWGGLGLDGIAEVFDKIYLMWGYYTPEVIEPEPCEEEL